MVWFQRLFVDVWLETKSVECDDLRSEKLFILNNGGQERRIGWVSEEKGKEEVWRDRGG